MGSTVEGVTIYYLLLFVEIRVLGSIPVAFKAKIRDSTGVVC